MRHWEYWDGFRVLKFHKDLEIVLELVRYIFLLFVKCFGKFYESVHLKQILFFIRHVASSIIKKWIFTKSLAFLYIKMFQFIQFIQFMGTDTNYKLK